MWREQRRVWVGLGQESQDDMQELPASHGGRLGPEDPLLPCTGRLHGAEVPLLGVRLRSAHLPPRCLVKRIPLLPTLLNLDTPSF